MKMITLEVGSVYGRLTVIGNEMMGRSSAAICRCECGTIKTIRRYSLTHGANGKKTQSCGCLAAEAARINFKADRGSSFETPEAAKLARKLWCREYAKAYDARPEQRELRRKQSKDRLDAMTPEQREEKRRKNRIYRQKPEQKARQKAFDAEYKARPGVKERLKQYRKDYYQSIKDDPEALKLANAQSLARYHANAEHYQKYHKERYQVPEIRSRIKKSSEESRKKGKAELTDAYVRRVFKGHAKLRSESIPQALVDAVRLRIQINRQLESTE